MAEQVEKVTLWQCSCGWVGPESCPHGRATTGRCGTFEEVTAFIPSKGVHLVGLEAETAKEIREATCEEDDGWWTKGKEPHCGTCVVCVLQVALEERGA